MPDAEQTVAQNKKAYHDYFVEETFEAGIELYGTEVKSIRQGTCNLKDAYLIVDKGELFAKGIHVSPYEKGNIFNRDPLRTRRLLMHKREILKLKSAAERDGYTLIPLSLYLKRGRVKVQVGVCKGKKLYDKREAIAEKERARENQRAFKQGNRD